MQGLKIKCLMNCAGLGWDSFATYWGHQSWTHDGGWTHCLWVCHKFVCFCQDALQDCEKQLSQCSRNGGFRAFSWWLSLRDDSLRKLSAFTIFMRLFFFQSSSLWLDTQGLVHGLHSVAHLFELCFQMADLCHFLGELLELFLNDLVAVIIRPHH